MVNVVQGTIAVCSKVYTELIIRTQGLYIVYIYIVTAVI
jgi:hypothetical protein